MCERCEAATRTWGPISGTSKFWLHQATQDGDELKKGQFALFYEKANYPTLFLDPHQLESAVLVQNMLESQDLSLSKMYLLIRDLIIMHVLERENITDRSIAEAIRRVIYQVKDMPTINTEFRHD